ncbi:hypothetical protein D3C76_478400 [compost metagenome]
MSRKVRQPTTTLAEVDPAHVRPREGEVAFVRGAVGEAKPVIREGQAVSYELALGPDGLWYAVNIVIEGEPPLN